jgi:HNH endonuclease
MPRAPYPQPQHPDCGRSVCICPRLIYFLHPGYSHEHATFLALPAADGKGSLHSETARLACVAVANNRTEGFLTEDRKGQKRVSTDTEAELDGEEYYFQVPFEDGIKATLINISMLTRPGFLQNYEIFPSFRHWAPSPLPTYWKKCAISKDPPHPMPRTTAMQVANRDISCRITQCKESTEIAHIIPSSEMDWYRSRAMSRHADFNDASNAVLLRPDVHKIWDSKKFTIIPRLSGEVSALVVHVFGRNCSDEVVRLYHDVKLQPVFGVKLELLHARFAWTLFSCYVEEFLKQDVKRWLRVRNENGSYESRLCSPQECRDYATRARSSSPSKRSRTQTSQADAEDDGFQRERSLSCTSCGSNSLTEEAEQEYPDEQGRGRKRRRSCSHDVSLTECSTSFMSSFLTEESSMEKLYHASGIVSGSEKLFTQDNPSLVHIDEAFSEDI